MRIPEIDVNLLWTISAAVFGGALTLLYGILKSKIDIFVLRYEDICRIVSDCADISSEYWLTAFQPELADKVDNSARLRRYQINILTTEMKILGLTQRILLLDEYLRPALHPTYADGVGLCLEKFIHAATGADFRSRAGAIQLEFAEDVQAAAAELISAIKIAVLHKSSPGTVLWSVIFWKHRVFG